jgi:hypothetical protein
MTLEVYRTSPREASAHMDVWTALWLAGILRQEAIRYQYRVDHVTLPESLKTNLEYEIQRLNHAAEEFASIADRRAA